MSTDSRDSRVRTADVEHIIETFAALAETLVHEFDLGDLLDRVVHEAVRLVPVQGAAILLARPDRIELMAASDQTVRRIEEREIADGSGPCVDAARDEHPRSVTDAAVLDRTWPSYASAFRAAGYRAVYARPMREREKPIGALNLFIGSRPPLTDCNLQLGQALADIAGLAVVQHGRAHSAELAGQLQHALNSRIVLEQAKGVVAAHAGIDMAAAFTALRSYARARQAKLSTISRAVVDRELHPREVLDAD